MARQQANYTFDALLQLKDAGAVVESGAATVASVAKIVDLGAARADSRAVVDVTAIDVASTDEEYRILIQGSNSATFASGIVNLATLDLSVDSAQYGGAADGTVGRYEMPFTTEVNGVTYRYVRAYTFVDGSTPSINYKAYIAKS